MKKLICTFFIFTTLSLTIFAQTNTFPANGNVGIGTTSPTAKITFNNVNDGSNLPDGITWYGPMPLDYGIYRTSGPWESPYPQLKLNWETGIILNPGIAYGKSYVDIGGGGLRVSSGNVGIGDLHPVYKLNVAQDIQMNEDIDAAQFGISGNTDLAKRLVFGYDVNGAGFGFIKAGWYQHQWTNLSLQPNGGNVGIGTTSPRVKLNVAQDIQMNEDVDAAQFGISGSTDLAKRLVFGYDVNGAGFGFIKAGWYQHQWTNLSLQPNGGNVGIGTTIPSEKLSVNGKIRAREIKVETANWPDYVFNKDYKILGLPELDAYIKANKHLPGMPLAKEVEANGIALGEMNKLLLQKVEELSLHLIEKDKQLAKVNENNMLLQNQIFSIIQEFSN